MLFWLIYGTGGVLSFLYAFPFFIKDFEINLDDNTEFLIMGVCVSLLLSAMIGVLSPAILVGFLLWKFLIKPYLEYTLKQNKERIGR